MASPTISIVTPLLNRAAMLPDALASVAAQGDAALEHIIVDGGSTDGAQAIARAAGATLIDAPGSSIYEALNIGIAHARGEVIALLNSDDRFADNALKVAQAVFAAKPALDLLRGHAVESTEGGADSAGPPTLREILLGVPNINACFIAKRLFSTIGPFNPAYSISADREWLARSLIAGVETAALDAVVYIYRRHPGSLTIGRNKPATAQWVREHIAFSRALLRDPRLTTSDRAVVRAFHAKETAHAATLALERGAPLSAMRAVADGFRGDALWPLSAIAPLAGVARRRARRIS